MLSFLIVSVAATVTSTALLSGNLLTLFSNASAGSLALTLSMAALVLLLGATVTYAAMRLALEPTEFGFVAAGAGFTPGKRLTNLSTPETRQRSADEALDALDRMVGPPQTCRVAGAATRPNVDKGHNP